MRMYLLLLIFTLITNNWKNSLLVLLPACQKQIILLHERKFSLVTLQQALINGLPPRDTSTLMNKPENVFTTLSCRQDRKIQSAVKLC